MKSIIAIAAALSLSGHALAQDPYVLDPEMQATAEGLVKDALESDLAWDIVESLTTEVGPRLAGSEAEARARVWGQALGESLSFDTVTVEDFPMQLWERGELEISLTAPYEQALYGASLGGSGRSPRLRDIDTEVVYFRNIAALTAVEDGALEGKIAFVDGEPLVATQTGQGYGPANQRRRIGWQHAERAGAAAIVVRSVGSDSHRVPHTGMISSREGEWASIPVIAVSNPDADHLRRLHATGAPMSMHIRSTAGFRGDTTSGNVVMDIVGTDLADEIVLIGGHLDSWDQGTGAVDDGSGIAITVAAAELIANLPERPRRTIRVVMFGAEEVGLLGGFAYAERHAEEVDNHVLVAESDFGADRIWQMLSNTSPAGETAIDAVATLIAPLGILRGGLDTSGGGPDVSVLAARGVPSVSLAQEGRQYFDLHHTPDDTLDKIDPDQLAQNVAAYAALIYVVANADVEFRPEPAADESSEMVEE
tara:strand:+ start:11990 stop:13429 length:1440 start_codon:yes stop_codon:yes gene_type:complete